MKPADIKPLYGIRDYFLGKTTSNETGTVRVRVPCSSHKDEECEFWCSGCCSMICEECFAGEHDGHQVRRLKNYLSEKLEKRLGGLKLQHSLVHQKELVVNLIQSNTSKLEEAKLQVTVAEKQLNSAIELKTAIDKYLQYVDESEVAENVHECSLMLDLIKFDFVGEEAEKQKIRASQSHNDLSKWSIGSESLPALRIALRSYLHVLSKNPLKIRSSDNLIVGSYLFWIHGGCFKCLRHQNSESCGEKDFRIIVKGTKLDPTINTTFTSEFELTLVNDGDSKKNKVLNGVWEFSGENKCFTEIQWTCLRYSELVDLSRRWISPGNFIEVKFEI